MRRFYSAVFALACLGAANQFCSAQASPWDGAWKMDHSSIKYDGPTFTVATTADGYTVTRGGVAQPKTVCDAKPHDTPAGSVTCVKDGTGYKLTTTKDGKVIRKLTVTLSADGKKQVRASERFPADGRPYTITTTAVRVSGGPGMDGVWRETAFQETQDTGVMHIKVMGDSVSFQETDTPKPVVCKLDGTPTKVPEMGLVSVKKVAANTLKGTYSDAGGKAARENTFVLSADGKSILETDITPAPAESKMVGTLHKM